MFFRSFFRLTDIFFQLNFGSIGLSNLESGRGRNGFIKIEAAVFLLGTVMLHNVSAGNNEFIITYKAMY